ncbi:hypothetical protein HYALB_00002906 [Hymenoscyphus albidus]|uniref:Uncharacterized protein n=1 Tax=Hymenoscyphus albidus TaxID=595503 RepID=A0A9N9QC86_9HELO|nr:hypothetical protein HYALB_00002906 [Hymenoscyphus albidus]
MIRSRQGKKCAAEVPVRVQSGVQVLKPVRNPLISSDADKDSARSDESKQREGRSKKQAIDGWAEEVNSLLRPAQSRMRSLSSHVAGRSLQRAVVRPWGDLRSSQLQQAEAGDVRAFRMGDDAPTPASRRETFGRCGRDI